MKLLRKYRLYTYTSLAFVIIIGFVLNFYLFRFSIHRTTDDVLNEYRIDVERYARKHFSLESLLSENNKLMVIIPENDTNVLRSIDETIRDSMVFNKSDQEMVVYRKLTFPVYTAQQNYIVRIILPTMEEDNLAGTVIVSLILLFLLFFLFTTFMDWALTKKILEPFRNILARMKSYKIEEGTAIQLENADIDEFQELNDILTGMMCKINNGYDEMKDFLEYTSHEIKTPLSIIQLKLEALNQKDIRDEDTLNTITSIQMALKRIIRFNRSLLFIAKIKNNQFNEIHPINLNEQIVLCLSLYEELLNARNIHASFTQNGDFVIDIHPMLAEQLIQNILTNAIMHNRENGSIEVNVSKDMMMVSNTFEGPLPAGNLFEKYKHSLKSKNSSGLGLDIVRNICIKNKLAVDYKVENDVFFIFVKKLG